VFYEFQPGGRENSLFFDYIHTFARDLQIKSQRIADSFMESESSTVDNAPVKNSVSAAMLAASLIAPRMTRAQVYLTKLVRLIVPCMICNTDTTAHIFGQKLAGPASSAPEEFTVFIKAEAAKWSRVIREAGITLTRSHGLNLNDLK
jgi:tripartite-type tricarboxylate transporter receptor subunit TctC